MEKHCNNSQCFKEKNYKAKFLISSMLKKSNQQRQFQGKKTQKRENNSCWKHCSNSQCFVMKATVLLYII